jgi:hypothetical protein
MSVIMSDMATTPTFTVRDLNRQPAKVLEACDRLGAIEIRSRNGRVYSLKSESPKRKTGPLPDFAARRRTAGFPPMDRKTWNALARLIAGE